MYLSWSMYAITCILYQFAIHSIKKFPIKKQKIRTNKEVTIMYRDGGNNWRREGESYQDATGAWRQWGDSWRDSDGRWHQHGDTFRNPADGRWVNPRTDSYRDSNDRWTSVNVDASSPEDK